MFLNLHYSQNSQIYFNDEIVLLLYNAEVVHENLRTYKEKLKISATMTHLWVLL